MFYHYRACEDVLDIAEFVETDSDIMIEFIESLKDVQSRMQGLFDLFEHGHLLGSKNAVVDQINAMRAKLENTIRKAAEDAIQKVNDVFNELNSEFKSKIGKFKVEVGKINKRCTEIQSNSSNEPQAFVLLKKGKDCILEAKQINEEMNQIVLDQKLSFTPNSLYEKILSTESCLGNVTLVSPYLYSFTEVGDVDFELMQGKIEATFMPDSCITDDGSIIFVDESHGMLYRVCSSKMNIVEYLRLPSRHKKCVCSISDQKIAVSLDKTIKLYRIGDKITFLRDVSTCIGVCVTGLYCHDNILYVACKDVLYKYNMDGKLLKSYKPKSNGKNVFSDIQKLVVNPLNRYIHVNDLDNGVITIDQGGSVVNIVKNVISGPHGLCLDKFGQVFVSGHDSNNIIQLSSDGKYITTVISNGIENPKALCFDERTHRLFVVYECGFLEDVIKVFDAKL